MKKTTFVNSHPVGEMKAVKLFGFTVVCLVAFLFVGMNQAQAQRMDDVSEAVATQTVQTIQAEMDALEIEVKTQPAGVKTDQNFNLIDFYHNVTMAWRKGGEFKSVLLKSASSIHGGTGGSVRTLTSGASGSGVIVEGSELKEFEAKVDAIDLNDGGASLQVVIDYLRTLKNQ